MVSLSFFQTIAFAKATPRGATYFLVNNYPPDYYWYLSLIEQGREGNLAIATRYSTTPFPAVPVNLFFSILGIVGSYSPLSNDQLYTFARFIFGVTQLMAVYFLIQRLSSRQTDRLFYFLVVLLSQSFIYQQGELRILYGGFWSAFDPFARFSNLPHHMAANTLMILSMAIWSRQRETSSEKRVAKNDLVKDLAPAMLLSTAGLINPGIYPIALPMFAVGKFLSWRETGRQMKELILVGVVGGLVLLYYWFVSQSTFPWNVFTSLERQFSAVVSVTDLLPIAGISGYVGIVGILFAIREKIVGWRMVASWAIVQCISLGFIQYHISIAGIRFIQTLIFVPFGLLAAKTILRVARLFPNNIMQIIFVSVSLGLYSIVAVDAWKASIDQQMASVHRETGSLLQHPPVSIRSVIEYLQKYAHPGDVTASTWWLSTILPGLTPVRVFSGHPTFSYDPSPYTDEHIRLLQYPPVDDAQNILIRRKVRYVVTDGGDRASEYFVNLGLREVLTDGDMRVFERQIE